MAQILKFQNGGSNKPKGKLIFNGIEYTADENLINSLYEYGSTLPAKTQQQFANIISSLEAGNTVTYGLNNIEGVNFDVNENQKNRMHDRVGNGFGKERHARNAIASLSGWTPSETTTSSKYEIVDYSSPMALTYDKDERGEFKINNGAWTLANTPTNTAIINYLKFIPELNNTTKRVLLPKGVTKENIYSWYSQNIKDYNEMLEDIQHGNNVSKWIPTLTSLGIALNSEKNDEEVEATKKHEAQQQQTEEDTKYRQKGYSRDTVSYDGSHWIVKNPLADTSTHVLTPQEKTQLGITTQNVVVHDKGKLYQEEDGIKFTIPQPGFNLGSLNQNHENVWAQLYKVGNHFFIRHSVGPKNWYGGYDEYNWISGPNLFYMKEIEEPSFYKNWSPFDVSEVRGANNMRYITYDDRGKTYYINLSAMNPIIYTDGSKWVRLLANGKEEEIEKPNFQPVTYARGGKTKSNKKRKIDLEYPIEIAHYIAANVSTNKAAKKNKEGIRKSALALMPNMPTEIYPIYTDNGIDRAYDIQKQKLYNSKIPVSDAAIKTAYQLENEDKIMAIEQAKLAAKSENLNKYNQLLQSAQQQYAQQRDNIADKQRQIISTAIMQESAVEGNRRQNNWQSLDNLFAKLKETNALKQEKNQQYQTVIDYYDQLNELDKTLYDTFKKLGGYDIVPDDKVQEYVNSNNWKGALETYANGAMTEATQKFYKQSYINRLNENSRWFKKGGKIDDKMLLLKTKETYKTINQLNKEIFRLFSKLWKNVD